MGEWTVLRPHNFRPENSRQRYVQQHSLSTYRKGAEWGIDWPTNRRHRLGRTDNSLIVILLLVAIHQLRFGRSLVTHHPVTTDQSLLHAPTTDNDVFVCNWLAHMQPTDPSLLMLKLHWFDLLWIWSTTNRTVGVWACYGSLTTGLLHRCKKFLLNDIFYIMHSLNTSVSRY